MKILAYALMLAGFAWGLVISADDAAPSEAAAPVAALFGVGFGLLTTHAVMIGSVRGYSRRIFGVAVALLAGALWM